MRLIKKLLQITVLVIMPFLSQASVQDSLQLRIQMTEDPILRIELLIKLGDTFEYSNPAKAVQYYQEAYEQASELKKKSRKGSVVPQSEILRAKSLRYMGIIHSDQGDFSLALEKYFEARQILESLKPFYTEPFQKEVEVKTAKLYNNIGVVYSRQGLYDLAGEYYQKALEIHQAHNEPKSIAVAYSSMGIVEARQANTDKALEYFRAALDIYLELQDLEGMAQSYNNIGNIHYNMMNWDQALELYRSANEVFEQMGFKSRVAATLNNIGLIHQRKGDFPKAVENFDRSLQIRIELGDQRGMNESFNNSGNAYLQMGEYAKARNYFEKALQLSIAQNDNHAMALSYVQIGVSLYLSGQLSAAIESVEKGYKLAQQYNLKYVKQNALDKLARYYSDKGDFRRAFEASKDLYELGQQILDEQKMKQINELEIKYQARENQQKIDFLEQEKELSALKIKQSETLMLILLMIIASGLFFAAAVFIFLKQRNKITMLKSEAEARMRLEKSDSDLRAILESHVHAFLLMDMDYKINIYNQKMKHWFESLFGDDNLDGCSMYDLTHPFFHELTSDCLYMVSQGNSRMMEKELTGSDGKKYALEFYCNPVYDRDQSFVQSLSMMIIDVTQQRDSEKAIRSDLKEKETLIKEIHHRVKNNMQVIISLIRIQSAEIKQDDVQEKFFELEQRVGAMAYVHEELYKSDNLAEIGFTDYLDRISTNLVSIYNQGVEVSAEVDMVSDKMNIDIAVPCGLIINELVSNALKHAFSKREKTNGSSLIAPRIDVLFSDKGSFYELRVMDNGHGFEMPPDLENTTTMGLHLVKILVEEQLKGSWSLENGQGVSVKILFPKE